jgi:GPH family glycoside/pentoside/hexuronide:cation symporter
LGKKNAFYITTGISIIGYLSKWFLFTPANPWLALIPFPLFLFGFAGLFPLVGSMIADVCDLDELESFKRREGMFGSIFWWVIKVGMAVALAAGGYILVWTGFDVELAAQTEDALFRMRLMDVLVPAGTSALAIWVMSKYDLTEEKAHEVRLQLEARKKKAF